MATQAEMELILRLRDQASKDLQRTRRELDRLGASTQQTGRQAERAGGRMRGMLGPLGAISPVAIGAAGAVGGLALGFKATTGAAIEWESSLAGVAKTMDDTGLSAGQFDAAVQDIGDQLRQMSTEIPITANELAGVAEAAGQLGIARDDVVEFTRTMAMLGTATDLTSEQAATAIARITNITGLATDEVESFGSALVDLGNNSAATEGEILNMATRIAAAGTQSGMTEGEILGLSAALTSVGVRAEAGGTAMVQVMNEITTAVANGSEDLDTFAEIAGSSAEDFAASWRANPSAALAEFIEGLNDVSASGGDTVLVLNELGLDGIRVSQALNSLAGAEDLLRDSTERGNRAMEDNNALLEEAERRYGTTASQIQIAKNRMNDAAVEIGDNLAPAMADAAETAADLAGALADFFEPEFAENAEAAAEAAENLNIELSNIPDPPEGKKDLWEQFWSAVTGPPETDPRGPLDEIRKTIAEGEELTERQAEVLDAFAQGNAERIQELTGIHGVYSELLQREAEDLQERINWLEILSSAEGKAALELGKRTAGMIESIIQADRANDSTRTLAEGTEILRQRHAQAAEAQREAAQAAQEVAEAQQGAIIQTLEAVNAAEMVTVAVEDWDRVFDAAQRAMEIDPTSITTFMDDLVEGFRRGQVEMQDIFDLIGDLPDDAVEPVIDSLNDMRQGWLEVIADVESGEVEIREAESSLAVLDEIMAELGGTADETSESIENQETAVEQLRDAHSELSGKLGDVEGALQIYADRVENGTKLTATQEFHVRLLAQAQDILEGQTAETKIEQGLLAAVMTTGVVPGLSDVTGGALDAGAALGGGLAPNAASAGGAMIGAAGAGAGLFATLSALVSQQWNIPVNISIGVSGTVGNVAGGGDQIATGAPTGPAAVDIQSFVDEEVAKITDSFSDISVPDVLTEFGGGGGAGGGGGGSGGGGGGGGGAARTEDPFAAARKELEFAKAFNEFLAGGGFFPTEAQIREIRDHAETFVRIWAETGDILSVDQVEATGRFSAGVSDAVGGMGNVLQLLDQLREFITGGALPAVEDISGQVVHLKDIANVLASNWNMAAENWDGEANAGIIMFSEAVSVSTSSMQSALEFLIEINELTEDFAIPSTQEAAELAFKLKETANILASNWNLAAQNWDGEVNQGIDQFSSAVSASTGSMTDTLGFLIDVSELTEEFTIPEAEKIAGLAFALKEAANIIASNWNMAAENWDGEVNPGIETFSGAVSDSMGAMGDTLSFLGDLSDIGNDMALPLTEEVRIFAQGLAGRARVIALAFDAAASDWDDEVNPSFTAFSEVAGASLDLISAAMDFAQLDDLDIGGGGPGRGAVAERLAQHLASLARTVADAFAIAAEDWDAEVNPEVEAFTSAAGNSLSLVSDAVGVIDALTGEDGSATGSFRGAVKTIVDDIAFTVDLIQGMADEYGDDGVEAWGEFAGAAGQSISLVGDAADAFGRLVDMSAITKQDTARFKSNFITVLELISDLEDVGQDYLDDAISFNELMQEIAAAMQSAAEAIDIAAGSVGNAASNGSSAFSNGSNAPSPAPGSVNATQPVAGFQHGGFTLGGGMAMLDPRELVVNPSATSLEPLAEALMSKMQESGGAGGPMTVNLMLDGRILQQFIVETVDGSVRRRTG